MADNLTDNTEILLKILHKLNKPNAISHILPLFGAGVGGLVKGCFPFWGWLCKVIVWMLLGERL